MVGVHIEEHRAEIGSARVEKLSVFHNIVRALLLPAWSHLARSDALLRFPTVGHQFQKLLITGKCLLPVALHVLRLGKVEDLRAVGVFVANGILKRSHRTATLVQTLIAQAQLIRHLTTNPAFFLLGVFIVEFAINLLGAEIFATVIRLVGIAHLGSLTASKPHRHRTDNHRNCYV